jgi:trimeric autotransporter adhesin
MAALAAAIPTAAGSLVVGGSPASASTTRLGAHFVAAAHGATTLAGTGVRGSGGDGGPAVEARLDTPTGIAEDGSGDLFIADTGNCRVQEVPARTGSSFGRRVHAGVIVTVAGGNCTGAHGYPPPVALAVDAAGDLFIASATGERVQELPSTTTTSFGVPVTAGRPVTLAGDGTPGFGGDGGPARQSILDDPSGLAVDPEGDLLIADTANCRLRLVAASAGVRYGVAVRQGQIDTVAGSGICGLDGDGGPARSVQLWDPGALAVDGSGDVLVADQGARTIRELAARSGTFFGVPLAVDHLGTVAGEGSYGPYLTDGLSALGQVGETNFPTGLALDGRGDLYVADGAMHAIRVVPAVAGTLAGQKVEPDDMYLVAGALSTGTEHAVTTWIRARMLEPTGLVVSTDGRLVYSDAGADVVRGLQVGG